MHIDCLKSFYKIATIKSISKVALTSHISQSALSQQILKLENELGVKLLKRSNKGVEPTDEGTIVLKYCEIILKNYDKMLDNLNNIRLNKNKFIICSPSTSISYNLSSIIMDINFKYPNFSFELTNCNDNNIEYLLLNNLCDISLSFNNIKNPNIICKKLGEDKLIFVSNSNLNLTENLKIDFLFLNKFILLSDNQNLLDPLKTYLENLNYNVKNLNIAFVANSIDVAKKALQNSSYISLLPRIGITDILNDKIKEILIDNISFKYELYLCYKTDFYKHNKLLIDTLEDKIIKGIKDSRLL